MIKDFLSSTSSLILGCFSVLAVLLFAGFSAAHAQTTPQFIPFWHAASFTPADFAGKVFPTEKTVIDASFELLRNGKFVDLSGKRVMWLVNGNELGEGTNKKSITFKNYGYGSSAINMDVRVFDFGGATLAYSFTIPATTPRLVIVSPYDKNNLTEKNLNVTALPYFWNITSLNELVFSWSVNSVSPEGSVGTPDKLSVTIPGDTPAGTKIAVNVSAQNLSSSFEAASDEIIYTVAP
ncbi:MAG: hypothetical protein Q8P97_00695 [bacterium]|nr:hypothetical protein [bacterium]